MSRKKRILIRLPEILHEVVAERAGRHLRSINSEYIVLLKKGIVTEESEEEALSAADELLLSQDSSEQK